MSDAGAGRSVSPRRSPLLLIAGALGGIGLALVGLLRGPIRGAELPAGTVVRVNDVRITAERYGRALEALAQDRRTAPDAEEHRRVLERLIDEELLVQRALALGLARADRTVRAGLVDALIASITAEATDAEPTRDELRRFYDESPDAFRQPGLVHVRQVFVRAGEDEVAAGRRIAVARTRLVAGEPIADVAAALGDAPVAPIPDAPVPPAKLLDYVGATALRVTLAAEVGGVTEPVRSGGGLRVLQVVARGAPTVPPFEAIEPMVRAEYRRRAGERALDAYLRDLRAGSTIVYGDRAP